MKALSRRDLLNKAGILAAAAIAAPPLSGSLLAQTRFTNDPFQLGVASGDPLSDGFVIWTRLAPDLFEPLPEPVQVDWRVAADEHMNRIVRSGSVIARPEHAHSVHVELHGLEPGRWYWYQFRTGGEASPVGRSRTAPAYGAPLERMRFAFASCQHYEQGFFTAYRNMAEDDLDLVLHLGDYIYENPSWADVVRRHEGPEPTTLAEYRARHALYKLDPDLQLAHARFPWMVTWDDHEVDNDYAGDQSQDRDNPTDFLKRRAAAYQAYYEHLPLRRTSLPSGPAMRIYQRALFGDLIEFSILDGRQYRSDQPCGEGRTGGGNLVADCRARLDPAQTMLGPEQERWLLRGFGQGKARWNVLAQQMLMAQLKQKSSDGREAYWTEGWDGYAAARSRILSAIAQRRPANPVVLGGDIHSFWVTDLKTDFNDPSSPTLATEFVGTSITSEPPPYEPFAAILPDNPHVKFFESRRRGYARCDVTAEAWRTDFQTIDSVRTRHGTPSTLASFVIENGRPGAQPA